MSKSSMEGKILPQATLPFTDLKWEKTLSGVVCFMSCLNRVAWSRFGKLLENLGQSLRTGTSVGYNAI